MENMLFFPIFSSFIFFCSIKFSMAVDTLSPGRFIRDGEKLVSPSRNFELGYFSPGKSKNRYLGIWYKKTPETVVWVANRNSPIVDPHGVLTISKNGNLVLLNETNDVVWSSNISQKIESPVAQLLDTGNLVLMDNFRGTTSESNHWQSFDYPSDTLLAGMKLGWNLKTGLQRHLTSWRSADDPSPGNYTFRYDNLVLPQICLYQGSVKISCGGAWNGGSYGANLQTNFLYERSLVHNEDELYYKFESYNNPVIMIMKLNPVGKVQRLIWKERSMRWEIIYSYPGNFCEHYGKCGDNSVCSMDKTPNCECLEGFKFKSQNNQTWPVTCVRSHSSDCKRRDRFLKLADIKLPDLLAVSLNESMNLKECEAECLKNCSCRAYANFNVTAGGRGCLMWYGDLIDIRKITKPYTGLSVYIRVSASEQGNKRLLCAVVIFVLLAAMLLPAFYLYRQWRRKLKGKEKMKTNQDMLLFDVNISITTRANEFCKGDRAKKGRSKESWLPLFSLASVSAATGNFCMRNKLGEGGFGPVYKGELLNGQEVAVKRLASQSGQGVEEFKNEMMLIAKLQHSNLVSILGCCVEKNEKILIYEYMPNKSLDFFLFDPTKKGLLGWGARVRIIEGIAQGLLYLHQYSRLRIIHRDLKASNILLDNNMNPKISDFGMARMFGGDELQANTNRIVGTYGYMSPEYALEGIFSIKSDVFSFGILLLETLSSKKNTGFYNTDSLNLVGLAWDLWNEDRAEDLMDAILENEASYLVLKRYINVALLCVQENAEDRPTTSEVVSMLTNELVNLRPPKQPAFSRLRSVKNSVLSTTRLPEACSVNNVTISVIDPR